MLLREERKLQGLTLKGLAKKSGVPFSTISEIERGVTEKPQHATLQKLTDALGLDIRRLSLKSGNVCRSVVPLNTLRDRPVPLISHIIGGDIDFPDNPYSAGLSDEWLYCHVPHSDSTYALTVQGDSMLSASGVSFPHGCTIFCDPDVKPEPGMLVIAQMNDSRFTTFKKLERESGNLELHPLNQRHAIITGSFTTLAVVIEKREKIIY